jgi:tetratricopeptide (TPR) repeat protein
MLKIQDCRGQAIALCNLGISLIKNEQHSEALENLQVALDIFRKMQESQLEKLTLVEMGKAYCALGDYEKAIAYNQQHLTLAQATLQQLRRSHFRRVKSDIPNND